MPPLTREKLNAVRKHNAQLASGSNTGSMSRKGVRKVYEESYGDFVKDIMLTRMGRREDRNGRKIAPVDISFAQALNFYYGITAPEKNAFGQTLTKTERELHVIKSYLRSLEVFTGSDTIASMAQKFGNDNLNKHSLEKLLVDHSKFDAVNVTSDINSEHRFIIPEVILAAIRLDYEAASMHNNWIASTQNISQRDVKMPQIKRGFATARKIGEAESIPFGTVRFGQKGASVFKVGIGFKISDELVDASSIDMLFNFLGEVGNDMSIASDVNAKDTLLNGEQSDNSESAPVVGTADGSTFTYKDIKRITSRMTRLRRNVTRVITGEDDGIDISELDKFQGFDGATRLAEFRSLIGVPRVLDNDVFVMPSNQIMFLAPASAMVKLQYKGLMTETRRNPQTQEEELFVSDHIGFAILRRDGRVILDKSVAYNSTPGNTGAFPKYMDIDSRISASFKNLQGS